MTTQEVVLSCLLSVIVGASTAYVYLKSRRQAFLLYRSRTDTIASPSSQLSTSGISLKYGSRRIESLIRTRVAFWNNGHIAIRGTDVSAADKVKITLGAGDLVLGTRILADSGHAASPKPMINREGRREISIDFDLLKSHDGFVIEFFHQKAQPIEVSGSVYNARLVKAGEISGASIELSGHRSGEPVASVSRLGYLWRRWGAYYGGTIIGIFALISSFLMATAAGVAPHVVDPHGFDLSSFVGQRALADAIRSAGGAQLPDDDARMMRLGMALLAFILGISAIGLTVAQRLYRPVPARIRFR